MLVLRLRAEIIGGVSTSVIGALSLAGAPSSPTVAVVGAHVEQWVWLHFDDSASSTSELEYYTDANKANHKPRCR